MIENNNTGRIYEVLKIINGHSILEMREALHRAWPHNFQITQLDESQYQKFLRNLKRELGENHDQVFNSNDRTGSYRH
jgi:hypothetical protein